MILKFQGCHIYGNLQYFKLNGNPDWKNNSRFFTFMDKNIKINNFFSGFLKKACQGCHISEGAGTILIKIIFSKYRNVCHSCHASAVSGNSMCCIQVGCAIKVNQKMFLIFEGLWPIGKQCHTLNQFGSPR